ncbi:MAG: GNAT family N-acetyltransferase [Muricauda sp.]|nr:GNAT family N-acetyltransferase [Allomuricauda sp.]MAU27325.1 GNAT family N-acetyltransferase [Allomuricauda sp.]MBC30222.1 GNAT family N-acetyltransferase [Allomuricauda sp.]|tara:strand:- start:30968 stop:31468 length:501 start_codon:yes stop_codon:yes gene_type:complete
MIRQAKLSEIPEILAITKACSLDMQRKGIYQWNENYPSRAAFIKDIKRQELYVKVLREEIIGAIVVSTVKDEEYKAIEWLASNDNSIYVHRLCVHPDFQGQGHAQSLMDFAEKLARKGNFASVRLDTFSQNLRNQRFYETRGYKRLGDVYFPKQSKHPFHCYELLL